MKIKINDLEFSYSSTPVLKDITLDIEGPKFVSILGPNGVGKSTFIHCINKILAPTGGTVMIDDVDVSKISIKQLAKDVGYVPYSSNETFPLTVVDTVLMGRHPHSKWNSLKDDLVIVYDTLKLLGIRKLAMRRFNELSAGQHQKVMLARGLVQQPKVLLLDEPTSNLDVRHQLDVTKILKRLSVEKSILIIIISHDINIAAKFSDEIIMMHAGSVYAVGKPKDVITEENLRVVYGVESEVIMDGDRPHIILRDAVPMSEDDDDDEEGLDEIVNEAGSESVFSRGPLHVHSKSVATNVSMGEPPFSEHLPSMDLTIARPAAAPSFSGTRPHPTSSSRSVNEENGIAMHSSESSLSRISSYFPDDEGYLLLTYSSVNPFDLRVLLTCRGSGKATPFSVAESNTA